MKKLLTIPLLISILASATSQAEILQDASKINGRTVFRTYDTTTFTLCYSFGTSYSSQPSCRNIDLFYRAEQLINEMRANIKESKEKK